MIDSVRVGPASRNIPPLVDCSDKQPAALSAVAVKPRDAPPHLNFYSVYRTVKSKRSPYSITERGVPELIPVLGSQPAGDVSHKPGGRLPLLSARPAVTLATLTRAATSLAAWRTEARWV